jgi:hypothetical protein
MPRDQLETLPTSREEARARGLVVILLRAMSAPQIALPANASTQGDMGGGELDRRAPHILRVGFESHERERSDAPVA